MVSENLNTIAPQIVDSQDEQITDKYINALVDEGRLPRDDEFKDVTSYNAACALRVERITKLESLIRHVAGVLRGTFAGEQGALTKLLSALKLTVKLHINDKDRNDTGLPGVSHQLRVVSTLLERYGVTDHFTLLAAFFHDAVEDRARLLELESETVAAMGTRREERRRDLALHVLGHKYGYSVQGILSALSTPLKEESEKLSPAEKNDQYRLYIMNIFSDPSEYAVARMLIKLADLEDNALTIGRIRDRANNVPEGEQRQKLLSAFEELREKYRLPLSEIRDLLSGLPPSHPVYRIRDGIIQRLDDALGTVYKT